MASITMKELLEAGVHFGHRTNRWNPKMKRYIYGGRNGIYIVDLHQTLKLFEEARSFIQEVATEDKPILFVGTKKQAQDAVEESAKRCRQYWVNQRWLGGMLTNYRTIKERIDRLTELQKMDEEGEFDRRPKKEASRLREELDRLERYLGGIKDMPQLPGAIFIVDLKKERIALQEARKLEIPVVAIVDTNCDPDEVDWVIPGNDDAIRAIKLMCSKMADAIVEVKQIEWQGAEVVEGEEGEEEGDESYAATSDDEAAFSAEDEGGDAEEGVDAEGVDAEGVGDAEEGDTAVVADEAAAREPEVAEPVKEAPASEEAPAAAEAPAAEEEPAPRPRARVVKRSAARTAKAETQDTEQAE